MTIDQPGAVDIDLLADYAGGALEGTPDQARVAAYLQTDPAWRQAFEELRTAEELVRADLAALPPAEPIPADVASRLEQSLRHDTAAPVVSLEQRRRKRYRVAAASAVAAGLVTIAGFGGYTVLNLGGVQDARTGSGADQSQEDSGAAPGIASGPGGERDSKEKYQRGYPVPVSASGTDYNRENLSGVRHRSDAAAADAPVQPPAGLERLATPDQLQGCLDQVAAVHPGTVTMADYARFDGVPAVVIAISGTGAERKVVVVGAECGQSGTDEIYHARV
ncbi:MAG: hypothetical protein ACRDT4_18600 [Micromonosporaceae bacterium]